MNTSILTIALSGLLATSAGAAECRPAPVGGQDGGPAWRARILERFDANGDGRLDKAERHAARQARHERLLQRFDANGDGHLDEGERDAARQARREHVRERIDANGNGVIDPDERAAIREARLMRRHAGPMRRWAPGATVRPRNPDEAARGHQRLQLQGVEGKLLPKRRVPGRHAPLLRHEAPGG
jgi:hypothetical protein